MIPKKTILESDPPIELASAFALKEGNSKKPIYAIHKWWARRLGSVFRLLLLGATHPAHKSPWLKNGAFFEKHDLSGIKVFDPFVGGGTTLVEASKCGASVVGVDIDPVAAFVCEKEIETVDEKLLQLAFEEVEKAVKETALKWYRTTLPNGRTGTIIYAFWVETIESAETGDLVFAHPHYQLCRDQKNRRQIVFCANCHNIAELALRRTSFKCLYCEHETNIRQGVVTRGRINAPGFETDEKMLDIYSEANPPSYHLFALQVLLDGSEEKVFKKADEADVALFNSAAKEWAKVSVGDEIVPTESIPTNHRTDRRPVSYGLTKYRDLFNPRQLLCLSSIGKAIKKIRDPQCREFLSLAFSDCLASNNMLCYYAFDYDKLTPLFGLHAYTKVTRPVENNVWGVSLGRGTFAKCFAKLLRGKRYGLKPYENQYSLETSGAKRIYTGESIASRILRKAENETTKIGPTALILNQSSSHIDAVASGSVQLILTDPGSVIRYLLETLNDAGFQAQMEAALDISFQALKEEAGRIQQIRTGKIVPIPFRSTSAIGIKRILLDHQIRAVKHGLAAFHPANFSVPGSGKTTVALSIFAALAAAGRVRKIIVVGPASCFNPWIEEYEEVFGHEAEALRLIGTRTDRRKPYAARLIRHMLLDWQ